MVTHRQQQTLLLLAGIMLLAACAAAPVQPPTSAPPPTMIPTSAPPAATALPDPALLPTTTPAPQPQPPRTQQESGQGSYGDAGVDLYAQDAPEFPEGLEWLNTDRPLTMAELRGKVVLIDFWTYGCINCIHNFPDLERLHREHPDELVIIGVHSGKFLNERETDNIRQTILRYGITHPTINDADRTVWRLWNAQAWPTLVLVDSNGVMAGLHVGEDAYRVFKPLVVALIREAEARGRLDRTPLNLRLESDGRPQTLLSFPGRVLADPARSRIFIADTNHHRIVVADSATGEVQDVIGGGERALRDGAFAEAALAAPQGMALAPDGNTLYIADAGNHAIRAADLQSRTLTTIAGTGEQASAYPPRPGIGLDVALSSPLDVAVDAGQLYIAMAGSHQIWAYRFLDRSIAPLAGSAREGIVDGPPADAELAQPSGLTLDGRGSLFFVDSESSTVRRLALNSRDGVTTIAGGTRDLFSFGDVDGIGGEARLQHPLALAYVGGALYIADSYNNKIKRVDPQTGEVRTLFGAERGWRDGDTPLFYEPGGIAAAGNLLYIADTNNHAIRVIDTAAGTARTLVLQGVERFNPRAGADTYRGTVINLPPATIAPGAGVVRLALTLPPGYKVNDLAPSAVRWQTQGNAVILPADADQALAGLSFPLEIPAAFAAGAGTLTADLTVIYCEAETPELCLIEEARLVAPLNVAAGGASALELPYTIALPREDS
jgi:DNA-binding beta-propeller fold protein YncE